VLVIDARSVELSLTAQFVAATSSMQLPADIPPPPPVSLPADLVDTVSQCWKGLNVCKYIVCAYHKTGKGCRYSGRCDFSQLGQTMCNFLFIASFKDGINNTCPDHPTPTRPTPPYLPHMFICYTCERPKQTNWRNA